MIFDFELFSWAGWNTCESRLLAATALLAQKGSEPFGIKPW